MESEEREPPQNQLARLVGSDSNPQNPKTIFSKKKRNVTPPKSNIEPENGPLEEDIPFGKPAFSGSILVFDSFWEGNLNPSVFFRGLFEDDDVHLTSRFSDV